MDPVPSSLGGGVVATIVLALFLAVADALFGGSLFVFATFTSLCSLGGPPYCAVGTPTAVAITGLVFFAIFAIAWPLFFAGFTWGIPGESGVVHSVLFALVLWVGYLVALFGVGFGSGTLSGDLVLFGTSLLAYVVYGVVLGGVYDRLAHHRTLLSSGA